MLNWVKAVKVWNDHQDFHDDYYGVPRKGGESYHQVKRLMGVRTQEDINKLYEEEPKGNVAKIVKKLENKVEKQEKIIYSPLAYKSNLETAKKVLFSFDGFTKEDKLDAIRVLDKLTRIKDNDETIQEKIKPIRNEASGILHSLKTNPKRPVGLPTFSPATGKPIPQSFMDFTDIINKIPDQPQDLVKAYFEQQKQQEKQNKKIFKKQSEEYKKQRELQAKSFQEEFNSKDSQEKRSFWGKYPDKLFEIFFENNIRDALDFDREKDKLIKKNKMIPKKPEYVFGKTVWSEYEDFLQNK